APPWAGRPSAVTSSRSDATIRRAADMAGRTHATRRPRARRSRGRRGAPERQSRNATVADRPLTLGARGFHAVRGRALRDRERAVAGGRCGGFQLGRLSLLLPARRADRL